MKSGYLGKSSPAEMASGVSTETSKTCFRTMEDSRRQGEREGERSMRSASNGQQWC